MNHSKRESTQPLANNGNNLNKSLTNSISQSMTKLNSLTPDDAVNCASGNFDNRPASAKDLSINDATIKQYKDNTPLPNTSVYKSMNSKVNKTDNLISSENNYDKIGSIKYAPAELSPDLMVVNMTNSLAASVSLSSSVGTVTSTTSGTAVTPNYIPNPDSYLTTTPTTFFYFCNNEGQLFAVPSTDYSAMLKQTDNSSCRELISGYSVPIQPSYLNGFPQWIPNQITVDNQNGSQQLQNASANPLVLPTNQG
ncbi:unnamed protein product, partial [Trichobilharzia regenti]